MPVPERPEDADVEITASARAKEMTVRKAPNVRSRPVAEPDGETATGSDRENLPPQIRTGETYQHIRIDYRMAARATVDRSAAEGRADSGSRERAEDPDGRN